MKWSLLQEGRIRCGITGMYVEATTSEVVLACPNRYAKLSSTGAPMEQVWELQSQRPGSGTLDVECLHKGPTLVNFSTYFYRDVYSFTHVVLTETKAAFLLDTKILYFLYFTLNVFSSNVLAFSGYRLLK